MTWNFRLVREDEIIALREVYYDDYGSPEMCTTGEVKIYAQFGEDVLWYQEKIAEGVLRPVLDFPFTGPQQMELEF